MTASSQLDNKLLSVPNELDKVSFGIDDLNDSLSKDIRLDLLKNIIRVKELSTVVAIDDITITDKLIANEARVGQWVILSVYTINAEMRQITDVTGPVITVSMAFAKTHSIGDEILLNLEGLRNITYWGADPSSSNIAPEVQAAINDFDYRLDTVVEGSSAIFTATGDTITSSSHLQPNTGQIFLTTSGTLPTPFTINRMYFVRDRTADTFKLAKSQNGIAISGITGGSGTQTWHEAKTLQGNNLFFPSGTWTIGSKITLPQQTTSYCPGTIIHGSNAVIRTISFTGPLFTGAAVKINADESVGGNNWYTFENLKARDETNLPSIGNSIFFDNTLYRLRLHRCLFSSWGNVLKSNDTTNTTEDYIQSTRISECGFSNCNFIVNVSKAWDFYFCNNQTEFCNKVVHIVGTDSAALIVGRICNNVMEGSGIGGHTFLIRGARALTLNGNYSENNGDTSNPDFDLTEGQQPRGITISTNRFSSNVAQNSDKDWYPIAINNGASGVTITNNEVKGSLIDYNSQAPGSGENWTVSDNFVLGEVPNSQTNLISNGCRTIRRIGYASTTDETVTNMDFGNGAPLFPIGYANPGSAYSIRAHVVGMKDSTGSRESAAYDLFALFEDDDPGSGLSQNGTTQKTVIETTVGWNSDLTIENGANQTFTTAFGTDIITSVAHGLSDGDAIYVITDSSDLPVPLVSNKIYFVRDKTDDTFKLTWAPGQIAINLTDDGTGIHSWRKRDIILPVTGAAATIINWWADVTIIIAPAP